MAGGTHLQQCLRGVHVSAQAQLAGGLLSDQQLVAGDHLDVDALLAAPLDCFLGVVARRVEQRQQAHELPPRACAPRHHRLYTRAERAFTVHNTSFQNQGPG